MLRTKMIELREKVIYESSLVEKMIVDSIDGLLEKNMEKLDNTLIYEDMINHLEMEIEEMCIGMIALYQPEAKDLRSILMILKMNNDFERMGDHAVNIIFAAKFLVERPQLKPLIAIPNMARETIKMLGDALNAYMKEDGVLAKEVCVFDDVIDGYRDQIVRELITYMISDPQNIERSLELMKITSNLERIADLCTNIAEYTIFIKEGRVIKHNIDNV
jgi:phosphate transport system protein